MNEQPAKGLQATLWKLTVYAFWFFFVIGLAGSSFMILKESTGSPPRPDLELDALVEQASGRLSVMVMRYTNVVYDRTLPQPDSPDQRAAYQLAQLQDMFTALAVARLHDQGRIDVHHPASEYLPELPDAAAAVTVAQLLTHTSGVAPAWTAVPEDAVLQPGRASAYAPLNYTLLAHLITAVTRLPAHQFIMGSVLGPLELTHTTWDAEREAWVGTADDLHLFEEYLNSNRVIGLKTHLAAFTAPTLPDGSRGDYAYGWQVKNYKGLRMERVLAETDAFNGVVMRFPEKNFAAVLLYDGPRAAFDTHALSKQLATIYLGREMPFPGKEDPTN